MSFCLKTLETVLNTVRNLSISVPSSGGLYLLSTPNRAVQVVSSAWNCTFLRTLLGMHDQAYCQYLSVLLTCALHDKGISLDVPHL